MCVLKSRVYVRSVVMGLSLAAAVPAYADDPYLGTALSHNGNLSSSPVGTGDVDVLFVHSAGITFGPHIATYNEIAEHHVVYAYDLEPAPELRLYAAAFISNDTGIPWSGFRIRLEGADFAGHQFGLGQPLQAPANDPVVDIGLSTPGLANIGPEEIGIRHNIPNNFTLAGSSILRSNDQGSGFLDAELTILFDQPYNPRNGSFQLYYHVIPSPGAAGNTTFSMFLTPIPVPEPATLALLGVGLLGFVRRRRVEIPRCAQNE